DFFYPVQPWSVNYFDALCNPDGSTRLNLFPSQYKSSAPGSDVGTRRTFSQMNFRLFYSDNTSTYGTGINTSIPALSDAPAIANVTDKVLSSTSVQFSARVTGNPAAGIQEVWVTYTDMSNASPRWQ